MHRTPRPRRRRALGLVLAAALLSPAAAACGAPGPGAADGSGEPFVSHGGHTAGSAKKGTVLDDPLEKPEMVLTDTRGRAYDFVEETKGRPTLLFFGYTNCPDVCPLTMGNIAAAKAQLPEADQKRLRVVFVTSDPERDTPEVLGKWLHALDPDFTGLTGDFDTIRKAARSVGVGLEPPVVKENGEIVSTHGSQVLAFLPGDDKAHVVYTADVPLETYEKELPKIAEGRLP